MNEEVKSLLAQLSRGGPGEMAALAVSMERNVDYHGIRRHVVRIHWRDGTSLAMLPEAARTFAAALNVKADEADRV
jgi:hypothetical protein